MQTISLLCFLGGWLILWSLLPSPLKISFGSMTQTNKMYSFLKETQRSRTISLFRSNHIRSPGWCDMYIYPPFSSLQSIFSQVYFHYHNSNRHKSNYKNQQFHPFHPSQRHHLNYDMDAPTVFQVEVRQRTNGLNVIISFPELDGADYVDVLVKGKDGKFLSGGIHEHVNAEYAQRPPPYTYSDQQLAGIFGGRFYWPASSPSEMFVVSLLLAIEGKAWLWFLAEPSPMSHSDHPPAPNPQPRSPDSGIFSWWLLWPADSLSQLTMVSLLLTLCIKLWLTFLAEFNYRKWVSELHSRGFLYFAAASFFFTRLCVKLWLIFFAE